MDQKNNTATLLLCVNPNAGTEALEIHNGKVSDNALPKFITRHIDHILKYEGIMPDSWYFRYDIDRSLIRLPETNEQYYGFYNNFLQGISGRNDVHPSRIIPMQDAYYCHKNGIDVLSDQAQHNKLTNAPGYSMLKTHFGIHEKGKELFPVYRAVDTGKGVLLYDLSMPSGAEAYDTLLQHCADHFFDKEFNADKIGLYDLHTFLDNATLERHPVALNFDFNHRSKDYTFSDLTEQSLIPDDIIKEGLPVKEYYMSPTSECYTLFVTGEKLRVNPITDSFTIALLDHISSHGYPQQRLAPDQWRFIFPHLKEFEDVQDKMERISDPADMEALQEQAKQRAEEILNNIYNDRRTCCEPQPQISPYFIQDTTQTPHQKL